MNSFRCLHQIFCRSNRSYHSSLSRWNKKLSLSLWVLLACDVGSGVSRMKWTTSTKTPSMIREHIKTKEYQSIAPRRMKIFPTRRQNRKPIKPTEGKGKKTLHKKTIKRIRKLTREKISRRRDSLLWLDCSQYFVLFPFLFLRFVFDQRDYLCLLFSCLMFDKVGVKSTRIDWTMTRSIW